MSTINCAIIAAAGRGKRLGAGLPKSLVHVNDYPIIAYQLYLLRNIKHVRIVVGFFEDELIAVVRKIRSDVIFVRNPNFRHTKTLQSFSLAAKGIKDNVLCIDGDMIINENDFENFLNACKDDDSPRIAISSNITDDPVYAYTEVINNEIHVTGFGRNDKSNYEWANVMYLPPSWLTFEPTDVFEKLAHYTPIKATEIDRQEVDTPQDLQLAENVIKKDPNYCKCLKQI